MELLMYLAGVIVEAITALTGRKALFSRSAAREMREAYWLYDISSISDELSFKPEVDFEEGTKASIAWYKNRNEL